MLQLRPPSTSSPVFLNPKSPPRSSLSPALMANVTNHKQITASPCPSPDFLNTIAASYSVGSPVSPKLISPTTNSELDSANSGGGNCNQEYTLLRALMESQIEYYNSLKK